MSAARDRIAAGALEVFCRNGYAATTVRDVAAHLGIQAPSLYSHVTSKAALLELVLAPMLNAVDAHLRRLPIGPGQDAQRQWLIDYRQLLEAHRGALRLVVCDLGVNQHSPLADRVRSQHHLLRGALAGFGAGQRTVDAATAAAVIGMLVWPVLWLPEAEQTSAERAVDQALAVLHSPAGAPASGSVPRSVLASAAAPRDSRP